MTSGLRSKSGRVLSAALIALAWLAACLLVEAADGYRVVFALPELDPAFTDRTILLAGKVDGHPLDGKQGPFRIVVPGETRMARWVRQVTALRVVQVQ